jgi:ABC-type phosphate transport system substrate-binding protein
MKKLSLHAVVLTLSLFAMPACFAQVAVVVGAKSLATALTAEQAAGLFLGKSDQLPGVGVALLLDQPESNPNRELFYTKVAGKSASQVKAAWSRLVFSGKGTPPKEIATSADVKKLVSTNLNAIGYIEKSAVDSSVKVLFAAD